VLVSDRSTVHPSREGYVWGRRRERPDGEDDLERQIEKRRVIYRYGFFAKVSDALFGRDPGTTAELTFFHESAYRE
jgi:hypothetical protein